MIAAELTAAAAILVVLAATYAVGRVAGKHSVIDTAWGLMFAAATTAVFLTTLGHGDDARRSMLLVMPVVWGVRLAVHIGSRNRGKPEDARYEKLLADRGQLETVLIVYGLQGGLVLLIVQPVVVGLRADGGLTPLGYLGVALWLLGLLFEGVGDWQLEQYKRDPQRGPVMDRGLWRYTRHPNYFGDACVWVGIFLVAAERWPGVLTLPSPAVMIYLLAFGSGKRLLERHMAGRPGFDEYVARTSGFIPLPPKRA
jgi:steroid 5-alpha reductase family enzyme